MATPAWATRSSTAPRSASRTAPAAWTPTARRSGSSGATASCRWSGSAAATRACWPRGPPRSPRCSPPSPGGETPEPLGDGQRALHAGRLVARDGAVELVGAGLQGDRDGGCAAGIGRLAVLVHPVALDGDP